MAPGGALDGLGAGTQLIIQDKTFVPERGADGSARPHLGRRRSGAARATSGSRTSTCPRRTRVTPAGMSAFGRWFYGPWFWPPAKDAKYPPMANPYYDPTCDPNVSRLLRAGAGPVDAEQLGRHGGLPRHPDRQRHGLPDHDDGPEDLPFPHPERLRRPVLEPVLVRRRPGHRHRGGSQSRARSRRRRPTRRSRRPRTPPRARRVRTGSRSATRVASCPRRSSCRPMRPPGSPIPPASTWAMSTSTRCCWHRPNGPTSSSTSPPTEARR